MKDEPKMEIDANCNKIWLLHGKLHREDGPAVEYANGTKFWYLHSLFHREDGPAIEWADGHKEWWLHGELFDCGFQHARAVKRAREE